MISKLKLLPKQDRQDPYQIRGPWLDVVSLLEVTLLHGEARNNQLLNLEPWDVEFVRFYGFIVFCESWDLVHKVP